MPRALAASLPIEILLLIIKNLAEQGDGPSASGGQRRLVGPLLVSRSWSNATLAFLYQSLAVRLELFSNANAGNTNNPMVGMHRSLLLDPATSYVSYASLVRKIFLNVVWTPFENEEDEEEDDDLNDDAITQARNNLDAEVGNIERLFGHLARNQVRPVTVRVEISIGMSKTKGLIKDEKARKEAALTRVSNSVRGLVEGVVGGNPEPTRGKLELVFNNWAPTFATDIPECLLNLAPFVTDVGCHELCSHGGTNFRSLPILASGTGLKRITLCSCWQLEMLGSLPQLTHVSIQRCYESSPEAALDKLSEVLDELSVLKSLEVALPNSDSHIRQLLRSLSPLNKLEHLHLNLYRPFEAVAPPSPDRMPIPPLVTLKSIVVWAHAVETRRSKARRADVKPELPRVLVDMLSAPRGKLRSLDLSWTDVRSSQLEGILTSIGSTLETLVVYGCKQLGVTANPLASLAGLLSKHCSPRVLTEVWSGDLADCDDLLSELRTPDSRKTIAEMTRRFPRISVFAILGPSNSDLELFAALKRQGDQGAELLDLSKWEVAQLSSPLDEDDEVGVFGDGSVKLDLRKLRAMAGQAMVV